MNNKPKKCKQKSGRVTCPVTCRGEKSFAPGDLNPNLLTTNPELLTINPELLTINPKL
jgi:hypothetical protein